MGRLPNLGLPRAVIVPQDHPYAQHASISPQQALRSENTIAHVILNRCRGQRPANELLDQMEIFMKGPQDLNKEQALQEKLLREKYALQDQIDDGDHCSNGEEHIQERLQKNLNTVKHRTSRSEKRAEIYEQFGLGPQAYEYLHKHFSDSANRAHFHFRERKDAFLPTTSADLENQKNTPSN